jgi:hypothetical protein
MTISECHPFHSANQKKRNKKPSEEFLIAAGNGATAHFVLVRLIKIHKVTTDHIVFLHLRGIAKERSLRNYLLLSTK